MKNTWINSNNCSSSFHDVFYSAEHFLFVKYNNYYYYCLHYYTLGTIIIIITGHCNSNNTCYLQYNTYYLYITMKRQFIKKRLVVFEYDSNWKNIIITKIIPFLVEPAIIFTLKIYVKFYFILYIYLGLKSSNIWN